jgi:hypothetical protein
MGNSAKFRLRRWAPAAAGAAILVLGTALAAIPAASAASHRASSLCRAGVNPYRHAYGALAACGERYYRLARTYALPDGGRAHVYDTPGGATTFFVPRRGFNPFLAGPLVRAAYHLPAPPRSGTARARWEVMAHRARFISPGSFIAGAPLPGSGGTAGAVPASTTVEKGSYGGYNSVGSSVTSIDATYTEPKTGTSCSDAAEATWAGLGNGTTYLAQAGTGVGLPDIAAHQAFYATDFDAYAVSGLTANQGEAFWVQITKPSSGSASFSFLMENLYNGKTASFAKSTPHDFGPNQADAVVEWPYQNNPAISNFGTVTFSDVEANNKPLGDYSLDDNELYDGSTSLATTSKLTNDSIGATYTVKYTHCN